MSVFKRWYIRFLASRCELALIRIDEEIANPTEHVSRRDADWFVELQQMQHKRITLDLEGYNNQISDANRAREHKS